jgi:hypothetical protein
MMELGDKRRREILKEDGEEGKKRRQVYTTDACGCLTCRRHLPPREETFAVGFKKG